MKAKANQLREALERINEDLQKAATVALKMNPEELASQSADRAP